MLGLQDSTNILDTLYGGDNGKMYQPDFYLQDTEEEYFIPDSPPSTEQKPLALEKPAVEIIAANEINESIGKDVDIRPRVFDHISKDFVLIDTGSMCCVVKPEKDDVLNN